MKKNLLFVAVALVGSCVLVGCEELNSIAVNIDAVTTLFDLVTPIVQGVLNAVAI